MPQLFPLVPMHIEDSKIKKPTIIHRFRSGKEQRITLPGNRLRSYELEWTGLSSEQLKVLKDFFESMNAQETAFVFWHPDLDENIYVRFEEDTLTDKTIKTGNYYASCVVTEVDEYYNDPIVGEILVDVGNITGTGVSGAAEIVLEYISSQDFFGNDTSTFNVYSSGILITALPLNDFVIVHLTVPAYIMHDAEIIYTVSGAVSAFKSVAGTVIYTPAAGDEQIALVNIGGRGLLQSAAAGNIFIAPEDLWP